MHFILLSPSMSPPDLAPADTLSDSQYRALSDAALMRIEAAVDRWLQDDVIDIDLHRTGGLLEMTVPGPQGFSKLIVNTQPPLHELWLAARGGGFHFKCVSGKWCDTRDGAEFFERLSEHATQQAGRALQF
jgi:CyaY protein